MRPIVANLFNENHNIAKRKYLISPFDYDLNDSRTSSEFGKINHFMNNAIAHDIADHGKSIAEKYDAANDTGGTNMQDVFKLLLVSSLSTVPNAIIGLSDSEIAACLAEPNRDITKIPEDLRNISTQAWYLHYSSDRKRFFKNTENLNAKVKSRSLSYTKESKLKRLKEVLAVFFEPSRKDCYQDISILPAIDDIKVTQDKVHLIIFEPHHGGLLHPDLSKFYEDILSVP